MAFWKRKKKGDSKFAQGLSQGGGSGHIKKGTAGSSNEISFSVLESKKESGIELSSSDHSTQKGKGGEVSFGLKPGKRLDSGGSKVAKSSFPKKSTGLSISGSLMKKANNSLLDSKISNSKHVKPTATEINTSSPIKPKWEASQAEIDLHKKRRRNSKRTAIASFALGATALLVVGVAFAVQAVQHQMNITEQLNDRIAEAKAEMSTMDRFEQLVDQVCSTPIEDIDPERFEEEYQRELKAISGTEDALSQCKEAIEHLQPRLVSPTDVERSNEAIEAINAETNRIQLGKDIVEWAMPKVEEFDLARQFVSEILEADSLAREAASLGNSPVAEDIQSSIAKSNECLSRLQSAKGKIEDLIYLCGNDATPEMSSFLEYVQLRISAQYNAINADEAFLATNSAKLIEASNAYNNNENQAAALITELSGKYPPDQLALSFEEARQSNEQISLWRNEGQRAEHALSLL